MSRVIQCELILPITAKFICVCTMYAHCIPRQLAWFYHGSWHIVCTKMNTIFGATFVGHCMYNVCTLYVRAMKVSQWLTEVIANVGSWACSVCFAHTAHACRWRSKPNRAKARKGQRSSVLCLQRMAQLSDLVIWCARNWWMFGATVFCSLRSHGTRLLLTQQSKPCLVMGNAGVCVCAVNS